MPDGDYYDDSGRTISQGCVYGWTSPDSYVTSRPYTDGQIASLEFDSAALTDTYTSSYAVPINTPVWEETRTSANGVMTFDGTNYLIADSSYAMLHDADYQTAVLLRDKKPCVIFRFGYKEKYLELAANGGDIEFIITDGVFSATDLVLLQEWLLAKPEAKLADWKAGDLCADGRLDTFDLTVMRQGLIRK